MPSKPNYYHELRSTATLHADRLDNLRRETTDLNHKLDDLKAELAEVRRDIARYQQRLDEHEKRLDKWDQRLWGFVALTIGALLSLAAGLIVAFARK
ncbi:MAG: hypothetical protein U0793_29900 [Gemmataceae bacterium]